MRYLVSISIVSFLALVLTGCGPQHGKAPGTHSARGTVKLASGKAVSNAYIKFVPTSLEGVEAEGEIDNDGAFTLSAIGDKAGAVPGTYKVVIDVATPMVKLAGKASEAKRLVPSTYTNRNTTPLTAEVKAQDNEFHFVLK